MIEYDFLWLEEYAGELIVVHLIFLSLWKELMRLAYINRGE
jgi:hypothetical protein